MTNIHLNKISISNARRFAKDVEICFGKGATIILAPNGTGKTTIFEAIELALTGSLESKLGNPPNALIRDGKTELDIRLDFENNLYCEVAFRHGQTPVLKGDHEALFDDKQTSVPYLLGLTHILDQRGKGWFVTSDVNGAGSSLDKLSIGQGLNKIFEKKTKLTKAFNTELASLENQYIEKVERKSKFKEIKEARDSASTVYKLVSLESIFQVINQGYLIVKKENADIKLNLQSLLIFLETTKDLLTSEIDSYSKMKIKYSSIESKLEAYEKNTHFIKSKEDYIESIQTKTSKLKEQIEELEAKIKLDEKSKVGIVEKYNRYRRIQNHLSLLSEKRKKYQQEFNDLQNLKLQLAVKQDELTESSKNLEAFLKLKKEHEILDNEIIQVLNKQEIVIKLRPLQAQWELLEKQKSDIEEKNIPFYEKNKFEFAEERQKLESQQIKYKLQIEQTKETIEKHLEGANAIQSSISNIARYLPVDQGKCPVCNTEFKPEELQKQIKIALDLMNPASHKMTLVIKDLEIEQKSLTERLAEVTTSIDEINGKIAHERALLEGIKSKVSVIFNSFPEYFG